MNISRRDTIILATLFNIFALACVLMTGKTRSVPPASASNVSVAAEAVNVEKRRAAEASVAVSALASKSSVVEPPAPYDEDLAYSFDEIDELLEEYIGAKEAPPEPPVKKTAAVKQEAPLAKTISNKPRQTYRVQPGDNPWTIAKKCKISVSTLLRVNNLDEAKAKNLKIGQVLMIDDPDDDDLNMVASPTDRFKYVAKP